ncbi:MAG TPA: hypothetical protein DET40_07325 [Lentisphaeria bacterium]|nr:MAG: hypothetical protein A2X45_06975 [Lentisphaerae bacterium GWF2_50_93]HCE43342.1 hypothetical protein [Lentisphaeria bacterium]
MIKIIKFSVDDVLFDSEAVSDAVNKACSRNPPAKVAGLCQVGETLMIPLEEVKEDLGLNYVIAPFPAVNDDEFAGEIKSRYYAGFSTIGVFSVADKKWALYSKENKSA